MMRATASQAGHEERILRYAAVVFALALIVHGADHLRRGIDVLTPEVFWAGNLQTVGALVTLVLVFTRSRWAPVAAVVIGFASAFGFTVVHLVPDWGIFSDAFPGAHADADVTALSWAAALFEVGADFAFGLTGLYVLHRRREALDTRPDAMRPETQRVA